MLCLFAWEFKRPGQDLNKAFQQLHLYTPALAYPPLLIVSDIQRIPILRNLDNIQRRDAILNPDGSEPEWPTADVIVGNPPFLGGSKLLAALGNEYVTPLRTLYQGRVSGGADLVTYWFEKARAMIETDKVRLAGLVATNSIRGGANRTLLAWIGASGAIFTAWSDESWINEGAAVRVSLAFGPKAVDREVILDGQRVGTIHADLTASTGVVAHVIPPAFPSIIRARSAAFCHRCCRGS